MPGTLLIFTTGRTDVQLALPDGTRRAIDGRAGEIHRQLAQGNFELVEAGRMAAKAAGRAVLDPEPLPADLKLCTPKLDAVIAAGKSTGIDITDALILETTRTEDRDDPHEAGAILERRLRETAPRINVRKHSYLTGSQRLERQTKTGDRVMDKAVVDGLERAVAEAVRKLRPSLILLSPSGGPGAVKTVIEGVARLHGGEADIKRLDVAEPLAGELERAEISTGVDLAPSETFNARARALALLNGGHLHGAWGAVSHLRDSARDRDWVKVVRWLRDWASSLPIENCDITELKDKRRSVRAALRVEFALRAGDVPDAVHGTVALFEAALWDQLLPLDADGDSKPLGLVAHPENDRLFQFKGDIPEALVRKGTCGDDEDDRLPFEHDPKVRGWYRVHSGPAAEGKIAKYYLKSEVLTQYNALMERHKLRVLRNDVAHGVPTSTRMAEARTKMAAAGLWSEPTTEGGEDQHFLARPLVVAVLEELSVKEPATLADRLVAEVGRRLRRVPDPPPPGAPR